MSTYVDILTTQKPVANDKASVVVVVTSSVEELDNALRYDVANVYIMAEESSRATLGANQISILSLKVA
jgi:hypothetical protein